MFGGGFAEQDALNGIRHFVASFFPIDALDESFGAGGLSVVHTAPPGKIIRPRPRRTTYLQREKVSPLRARPLSYCAA